MHGQVNKIISFAYTHEIWLLTYHSNGHSKQTLLVAHNGVVGYFSARVSLSCSSARQLYVRGMLGGYSVEL